MALFHLSTAVHLENYGFFLVQGEAHRSISSQSQCKHFDALLLSINKSLELIPKCINVMCRRIRLQKSQPCYNESSLFFPKDEGNRLKFRRNKRRSTSIVLLWGKSVSQAHHKDGSVPFLSYYASLTGGWQHAGPVALAKAWYLVQNRQFCFQPNAQSTS